MGKTRRSPGRPTTATTPLDPHRNRRGHDDDNNNKPENGPILLVDSEIVLVRMRRLSPRFFLKPSLRQASTFRLRPTTTPWTMCIDERFKTLVSTALRPFKMYRRERSSRCLVRGGRLQQPSAEAVIVLRHHGLGRPLSHYHCHCCSTPRRYS
jgi:hypothetical protein